MRSSSLGPKVVVVALVGALALAGASFFRRAPSPAPLGMPASTEAPPVPSPARLAVDAQLEPRAIFGSVWFDAYPRGPRDEIELWYFSRGGFGIQDKGSSYKTTFEVFDFERQGDRLAIEFLQDRSKVQARFEVKACDDKPPFDACLVFADPLRGRTKLYGWLDEDAAEQRLPWLAARRAELDARIRGVKQR